MIELVDFNDEYIEKSVEWHRDEILRDRIGLWNDSYTDEELRNVVLEWINKKNSKLFGISKEGKPIGYILLKDIDTKNSYATIHITITSEEQNKGYGYKATQKIIDYAFDTLGLNKLCAYFVEDNRDIIEMMRNDEPFGFVEEGTLRESINKKGRFRDLIYFGLLKKDYIYIKEK